MYKSLIRPLLFLLSPESAHHFTFTLLKFLLAIPGMKQIFRMLFSFDSPKLEKELFGIKFKNPIGLAAGFDKDAKMIDEFACLGFGFIEIGTITPVGQPGNEQPRLFRLPQDSSLINRMGFNNDGSKNAVQRLKKRKSNIIVGGNIGKNKITLNEDALSDYIKSFDVLFDYVDYFVVNVSSPNTPNLRELQEKEPLKKLLTGLISYNREKNYPKPLLLKIAPDLNNEQLDDIIEISLELKLDGLIATNTTIDRSGLQTDSKQLEKIGNGGLSGKAMASKSTQIIAYLSKELEGKVPIIGVGGVFSPEDAIEKLNAGASLIQVYTGLIYEGPGLIKKINQALSE